MEVITENLNNKQLYLLTDFYLLEFRICLPAFQNTQFIH